MIEVMLTHKENKTNDLIINGHSTYSDAPTCDNFTYKKVCACVTLVALTLQNISAQLDNTSYISKGYFKVTYSKKDEHSYLPLMIQLTILCDLYPNYISVKEKEE